MAGALVVLLGAGSSFDCTEHGSAVVNPEYRPPLVNDLFSSRDAFNHILNRYPGARSRADEIRTEVSKGVPLEQLLRRMAESRRLWLRRSIWEVPLYLQELLGEIGVHYLRAGSTKFETLVSSIMGSDFDEILILTVNYDRFVERAVLPLMGKTFRSMDDYVWSCDGQHWALVKLHGSVDWGRRLRPSQKANSWEQIIPKLDALDFDADIQLLNSHGDRNVGEEFFYPALSLPLIGKTDFVCPSQHLEYGQRFVENATHLLVIGFSGLDDHVLRAFLPAMNTVRHLRVVCENNDMGLKTWQRLKGANPRLDINGSVYGGGGFAKFIRDGELNEFVGGNP